MMHRQIFVMNLQVVDGTIKIHLYSIEKDELSETYGKSYTNMTKNADGSIHFIGFAK